MYKWWITDCWPIVGDCVLGDEATDSQISNLVSKCLLTNLHFSRTNRGSDIIFFKNLSLSKLQSGLPLTTTSSQLSLTDQFIFSGSFKIFQSLFWISRSLIFMSFHLNFIFHFPCFQFNFSSISAHYFRSHVQVSRSNHCSLMNNCSLDTRNHTCIGYCSPKVLVKSTD